MPTTPSDLPALVRDLMPGLKDDLARLVAIPSVAFPGFPDEPVQEAAQATLEILRAAGLHTAELLEIPGAPPAVFGELPGPTGAPTVLLYAHYDVQPAGDEGAWTTPPFTLTERDGRLYGRGAADDKCGVILHAGALRALLADDAELPVTVKVIVEGEEETGRGTFEEAIAADPARFAADVIVVADSGNWKVGEPTLTTTLRGLCVVDVEVRTLAGGPVHSGLFGGAVPDALMALARLLATLHDDAGNVVVEGLLQRDWDGRPVDEAELRSAAQVAQGVHLLGSGSVAEQLYMRPSLTAIGIDAPAIEGAANALVPVARARISARLAPGQDAAAAQQAIIAHLQARVPWGAQLTCTTLETAGGAVLAGDGPAAAAAATALEEAYGKPAVKVGSGGAIPLCVALAHAFPKAEIVLWGASDDGARIHSADESVDASELEHATLAQALLLRRLGATTRS